MNKLRVLWVSSALFSWLMVLLAWRFAHPIEIIADWLLLAFALTAPFLMRYEYNKRRKFLLKPENYR